MRSATRNAVFGGIILAMIEGMGAITRITAKRPHNKYNTAPEALPAPPSKKAQWI